MKTPAAVIDFWFGSPPTTQPRREWFQKDAAFDALIRARFGTAMEAALAGGLQDPHCNAVLGRVSTAEEEAFLRQPGFSF